MLVVGFQLVVGHYWVDLQIRGFLQAINPATSTVSGICRSGLERRTMCLPEHHPILHGSSQGGWLEFSNKNLVESKVDDGNHLFTDIHVGLILKMILLSCEKKNSKKKGKFSRMMVPFPFWWDICSFPGGLSFTLILTLRVTKMSVSPFKISTELRQ